MTDINNDDDIIDSRDVIARIEELQEMRTAWVDWQTGENTEENTPDPFGREEAEELAALEKLAEQGESYASDWEHGGTLIRDSYFQEYAERLADDIGAIDKIAGWPLTCIDWEQAARELQSDYTAIDFDGVTYWTR